MPPTEGRDTLRERLALLFNEPVMHLSEMTFGEAFGGQEPDWVRAYGGRVDAILAEIETAGYRIVAPVAGNMYTDGDATWAHDGEAWAGWER